MCPASSYCSRSNIRWTCQQQLQPTTATTTAHGATTAGRAEEPAATRRTTSAGLHGTFKNSDTNLHRTFPVPAVVLPTSFVALRKLLPEPMSGTRSSPQRRGELSYLGNTARQDWRHLICTTLVVRADS
uniref:(northern house mosquito) hypothetical protein n=1 Tax=Culex pipiens TaxID=7175 RepID=A0A8D8K0Q5_CULPI